MDILATDRKNILSQLEAGEQEIDRCNGFRRRKSIARAFVGSRNLTGWSRTWNRHPRKPLPTKLKCGRPCRSCCRSAKSPIAICSPPILRLQEVNRQKTVFLASAAHELKTPLAVIKGYYDLLLSGSLGQTERQAARHPAGIQRKLRAAGSPGFDVPELFGAGKRQAGPASARKRSARLPAANWRRAGTRPFSAKHVRLDIRFDHATCPFSNSITRKCSRRVANLLDNALKHTPAGGSVTLRAEPHFWERRVAEEVQPRQTAGASASSSPTASRFPCRIPGRASLPNIIRKFSRILCAWTAPRPGWAWVWRLPSGWCKRIAEKFGWIANRGGLHVYVPAADRQ